MELSVDSLRASGGFVGGPVKRQVTWTQGGEEYTADVYVRRMSYHSAVTDAQALDRGDELAAHRIAQCICDEHGKPVFEVSDITGVYDDGAPVMETDGDKEVERGGLHHSLVFALLVVIGEVNELGKTQAGS